MQPTKQAITNFVDRVTKECRTDPIFKNRKTGEIYGSPVLGVNFGRKYAKITADNGGSAWGFVNMETGDLLKAASWSAPARHARGNIETAQYGRNYVWTGPVYLR